MATDMGGFAQAGGPAIVDRFGRPLNSSNGIFIPYSRTDTLVATARWQQITLGANPIFAGDYGQTLIIFKNGSLLVSGADYVIIGRSVSFTPSIAINDVFVVTLLSAIPAGPAAFSFPYGDPYFANVTSLLHFNGNFTDVISGVIWTPASTATTSSAQPKWGSGSYDYGSNYGAKISANNSAFTFGTSDFTVECWVYPTSAANFSAFYFHTDFIIEISSGIWAVWDGSNPHYSGVAPTVNDYQHVAICRKSGVVGFYVGGNLAAPTWTWANNVSSTDMTIGYYATSSINSMPYVDDFRTTKYARYDGPFSPPSAQFPDSA